MIRFACLCKHRFEVDEQEAGGMIQCPACGRLNDVPTLSDLPHLNDDGTYNVEVERPRDDPARLAQLGLYYAKGTVDAEGDEIDLRVRPEDVAAAGADSDDDGIPLKDEDGDVARRRRTAPRYDPETGELIRPLDLKPDPEAEPIDPRSIPVAKAAINYARGETGRRVTPMRVLLELLMPVNVAVMLFVFIVHVFLQMGLVVVRSGLYFLIIGPLVFAAILVSHYGNVIDEIGPQDRDELPRPLRTVSLRDDLWDPFINVAAALMLCYLPVMAVLGRTEALPPLMRWGIAASLTIAATAVLPAVLLTTTISGSYVNLRPDRLIGFIRACGPDYVVSVIACVLALGGYVVGMLGADMSLLALMGGDSGLSLPRWVQWAVGYPLLAVGIYLAHFFCWHLGLLYRAHHAQFPWVMQRHVKDPMVQAKRFGSRVPYPAAAGADGVPPRVRKDTQTKLRELRELERKRRAEKTLTDQVLDRSEPGTGPTPGSFG